MESLEQAASQALVDTLCRAVVVIDTGERIQWVNRAAADVFGYSREQLVGQPVERLIPPHYRQAHREHVRHFQAEEAGPSLTQRAMGESREIRGLRASGETFPAEASVTRLTWNGATYMVALVSDLSDVKALENQHRQLARILEGSPDFVGMADAEGNVIYRNRKSRILHGAPGSHIRDAHPPEEARRILEEIRPIAREKGFWEGEVLVLDREGNTFPISQLVQAHYNEDGEVTHFSSIGRDLRPYRETEQRLQHLLSALDQTADMVWITDTEGTVEYVNQAVERTTGYRAEEICGLKTGTLWKSGHHDEAFYEELWSRISAGETYRNVFVNRDREGRELRMEEVITPVQDADGTITHFIATGRDISERLALEERLQELAYFDPLTGLANRTHFESALERSLAHAQRSQESLALLMLDVDRFKDINDSLGHAAGDELLVQIGQRLSEAVRAADLVARWGGDEFLILLDPVRGWEGAQRVAGKLQQAMEPDFTIQGATLSVHISIGISLYPENAGDAATLLKQSDIALFKAKHSHGISYRFFSPQDSEAAEDRFYGERNLRQAISEESCEPFFQPVVDLRTGTIIGVEALARCRFAGSEAWISPDQFIPVAERTGLIHALGIQILRWSCQQFRQWRDAGYDLGSLAVNLSPIQLEREDFARLVSDILEETGCQPQWLELEITEETSFTEEAVARPVLEALRDVGVSMVLDDFGKGYSTPSSLYKLPVSRMKIDRAFIRNVDRDVGNQTIVKGLLGFAKGFNCRVTVEGVERIEEAEYLRTLEIGEAQGFLFGRPVPADEFERLHLSGK